MDIGAGYGTVGFFYPIVGMIFSPEIGWKIDIGKEDGFVLGINLRSNWCLGYYQPGSEPYNAGETILTLYTVVGAIVSKICLKNRKKTLRKNTFFIIIKLISQEE
ncbi:hypothetical protein FACS189493_5540 [Spirochaetia bacterium]|nr:hypothetical protein FACS189493_5540 [Spirochaetia bacterium]